MTIPQLPIFNPAPEFATAILSAFSDPKLSFRDLADIADASMEALSFWLEQDEIQDRLNNMHNTIIQRNRMMAAELLPNVTRMLAVVLSETEYVIKKVPLQESNLQARETHRRIYETGRRAGAMIYKLANQPYITVRRPKLYVPHPIDIAASSSAHTSSSSDQSTAPGLDAEKTAARVAARATAKAAADAKHAAAVEYAQSLIASQNAANAPSTATDNTTQHASSPSHSTTQPLDHSTASPTYPNFPNCPKSLAEALAASPSKPFDILPTPISTQPVPSFIANRRKPTFDEPLTGADDLIAIRIQKQIKNLLARAAASANPSNPPNLSIPTNSPPPAEPAVHLPTADAAPNEQSAAFAPHLTTRPLDHLTTLSPPLDHSISSSPTTSSPAIADRVESLAKIGGD